MFGLNSKNAPGNDRYVVVQTIQVPDGPDRYVTPCTDQEAAQKIVDAVLDLAPEVFAAGSGNSIRVVTVDEWNQALVAEAVLQS